MEPTTNQLQLGPVEENTVPLQEAEIPFDPAAETLPNQEIGLPEQEEAELLNPMSPEQGQELAYMAGLATMDDKFFQDPARWTPQYFREHADEMLAQLEGEEESVRRQAILEALSSYDLDVNARIALAEGLVPRQLDTNIVLRNAAATMADSEMQAVPDDVANPAAYNVVEELPEEPVPEYMHDYENAQEYFDLTGYNQGNRVRDLFQQAEKEAGGLDVLGVMIPGAYQTLMDEIARAAGVTAEGSVGYSIFGKASEDVEAIFSPGSLAERTAQHLEVLYNRSLNGRKEDQVRFKLAVDNVLDVLKNNSGMVDDVNHVQIAYVLSRVFPRIIKDESAFPAEREKEAAFQARLATEDRAAAEFEAGEARAVLAANYRDGDEELLADAPMNGEKWQALSQEEKARLLRVQDAQIKLGASTQRSEDARLAAIDFGRYKEDVITFDTFLDTFGAVDDLFLTKELVMAAGNLGRRLLKNKVVVSNKAAPTITAQTVARDLMDKPSALTTGTSREDLLDSIIPSVEGRAQVDTNINAAPFLRDVDDEMVDDVINASTYTIYTQKEMADAAKEITDDLVTGTTARPASLNLANSTITPFVTEQGTDGLRVSGVFGAASNTAFRTANDAMNAALQMFGRSADIQVMRYNGKNGGQLVPADMKASGQGRFYFSVNATVPYQRATNVNQFLAFGEKAIRPGPLNRVWWKMGARTFQPLANMATVFNRFWNVQMSNVHAKETRVKQYLMDNLGKIEGGLGGEDLDALNHVLRTGGIEGKVYTRFELEQKLMSAGYPVNKAVTNAYYETRRLLNSLYKIADNSTYFEFARQGLEEIVGPLGRIGFGKPVSVPSNSINVFDPITNAVVKMTPSQLNAITGTAGELVRLQRPVLRAGKEAEYTLVGGATRRQALPRSGLLPRIEGYVPKVFSGTYTIIGVAKDGTRKAVGTAATKADADKLAARLTAKKTGFLKSKYASFSVTLDTSNRGLQASFGVAEDVIERQGGVVFGRRNGSRLLNGSGDIVENQLDPISATIRAIDAVSYQVTKGDLIRQLEDRAWNLINFTKARKGYKDNFATLEEWATFFSKNGLKKEADKVFAVIAQNNVARGITGLDAAMIETFWSTIEKAMANTWGLRSTQIGRNLQASASKRAAAAQLPLANEVMAYSHITSVATNLAQLLMQLAQPLLLTGQVGPVATARGYRLGLAVSITGLSQYLSRGKFPRAAKAFEAGMQKASGLTKAEWDDFMKYVRNSGLIESVAVDTRVAAGTKGRAVEGMLRRINVRTKGQSGKLAQRQMTKARNMVAKGGANTRTAVESVFVGSEIANQVVTVAALYSRDRAKGVAKNLSDRRYTGELTGMARQVTGSMNPEASFGFQRGPLRTMFQFVSFAWKMTQLATPEILGGARTLTKGEKVGMWAGQFALYGLVGLPFGKSALEAANNYILSNMSMQEEERTAFEQWWMSDTVQNVLNGFLIDYSVHWAIRTFADDNADMDIAGRLAPLAATDFAVEQFTKPFLTSEGASMIDLIAGIPGQQASKLVQYLADLRNITLGQITGDDDVPLGDRIEQLSKEGLATVASQYRRELALEIAEAADGFVVGGGMISQNAMTDVETTAFRLFGINPKDREAYYRIREEYRMGTRLTPSSEDRVAEAEDYANQYFQNLLRTNAMWHDDALPADKIERLLGDWVQQHGLLFDVAFSDDKQMADMINQSVMKKVDELMSQGQRTRAEQQLVDTIVKKLGEGAIGDVPKIANYIQFSDDFTENQKAQIIIAVDQLQEKTEAGE